MARIKDLPAPIDVATGGVSVVVFGAAGSALGVHFALPIWLLLMAGRPIEGLSIANCLATAGVAVVVPLVLAGYLHAGKRLWADQVGLVLTRRRRVLWEVRWEDIEARLSSEGWVVRRRTDGARLHIGAIAPSEGSRAIIARLRALLAPEAPSDIREAPRCLVAGAAFALAFFLYIYGWSSVVVRRPDGVYVEPASIAMIAGSIVLFVASGHALANMFARRVRANMEARAQRLGPGESPPTRADLFAGRLDDGTPVEMRQGVWYRYVAPSSLQARPAEVAKGLGGGVVIVGLLLLALAANPTRAAAGVVSAGAAFIALAAIGAAVGWDYVAWRRRLHDRFQMLSPTTLKVQGPDGERVYELVAPAKPVALAEIGAGAALFRGPEGKYALDPRVIVEAE